MIKYILSILIIIITFSISSSANLHTFMKQTNIFSGEVASNLTIGKPLSVSSAGTIQTGLYGLSVSSQSTTTTTSATPALLNSMTLTPTFTGNYFIFFDTSVQSTTGGNSVTMAIYNNGTIVTASSRTIQFPTATLINSGYPFYIASQAWAIPVIAGQSITIEWSTSGGTATCLNRTLTAILVN